VAETQLKEIPSWRDLALEEHRALRTEVIASLQGQLQALGLGTAAIGVLAAGAFTVWEEAPYGAAAVFFVGLPALALLGLFIWTGENARIMRAGTHLLALEQEMKRLHPDMPSTVFSWERRLAGERTRFALVTLDLRYLPVSIVYATIAIGSVFVGRQLAGDESIAFFSDARNWLATLMCAVIVGSLAVCLVQIPLLRRRNVRTLESS
jgi:hypothetical protein